MATIDEMLESGEDFAAAWIPENPGDSIMGIVVARSERDAGWGIYPILTIETDKNETWAVHCTVTALKAKVVEKNPVVGDSIGIKYMGLVKSKTADREYKNFRVVVKHATVRNSIETQLNDDGPF